MKRVLVFSVLLAFGCSHDPAKIHASCQRWAAKWLMYGTHADPVAYREDLMSTCMALKNVPYDTGRRPMPPDTAWINPSVGYGERTKTFGRDKANCLERAYVGQASRGSNSAEIRGSSILYGGVFGSGVSGSQTGDYNSAPAFNSDLFVACMNEAGWELSNPARDAAPQ